MGAITGNFLATHQAHQLLLPPHATSHPVTSTQLGGAVTPGGGVNDFGAETTCASSSVGVVPGRASFLPESCRQHSVSKSASMLALLHDH